MRKRGRRRATVLKHSQIKGAMPHPYKRTLKPQRWKNQLKVLKEAPTRKHQLIHKNADKRRRDLTAIADKKAHKIAQELIPENVDTVEVKSNSLKQDGKGLRSKIHKLS